MFKCQGGMQRIINAGRTKFRQMTFKINLADYREAVHVKIL